MSGFKTHLTALVGLIVAALVGFGFVSPEAESELAKTLLDFSETVFALFFIIQSLIAIFMRMAVAKAEKKAAGEAEAAARLKVPGGPIAMLLLCAMALPCIAASCTASKRLVDENGNPIPIPIDQPICVETEYGRICRYPNTPPPPTPTPQPILPAAKSYTAPLEK